MKKAEEGIVEKAMGIVFDAFYLLMVPCAILMAWWMHGDINLTLDSDGLPIITQVFTFCAYLIPAIILFALVLGIIYGMSLFYYWLKEPVKEG